MTDSELLREFAQSNSNDAFAELARRHADWVYSAAVRMVRDHHLAEEVTQAVFIVLAKKAGQLINRSLNAWLFKVTRYSANQALRTRSRRLRHEREAAAMAGELRASEVTADWEALAGQLDELVWKLRRSDREITLLRFYQRKSMADVAAALGISQDAAKKRVSRSVEKLRSMLSGKGVILPALALTGLLFDQVTNAAPIGLAASCASATTATTAATASSTGAASLAKGVMTMFKTKTTVSAAVVLALALVPTGIGAALWAADQAQVKAPDPAPPVAAVAAPAAAAPAEGITLALSSELTTDELAAIMGVQIWRFDVTVPPDVNKILVRAQGRRHGGAPQPLSGILCYVTPEVSHRILVSLAPAGQGKHILKIMAFGGSASSTVDDDPLTITGGGYSTTFSTPLQYPDGAFALAATYKSGTGLVVNNGGVAGAAPDPTTELKNAVSVLAMTIEPQ